MTFLSRDLKAASTCFIDTVTSMHADHSQHLLLRSVSIARLVTCANQMRENYPKGKDPFSFKAPIYYYILSLSSLIWQNEIWCIHTASMQVKANGRTRHHIRVTKKQEANVGRISQLFIITDRNPYELYCKCFVFQEGLLSPLSRLCCERGIPLNVCSVITF